jgi:hypothetical protein
VDPIPYAKQHITDEDIQSVIDVLRSDYLTQGPKIAEFEQAFAAYIGSKYAVAVSNGTAALHLSALAIGIKPGDKVITTPITFAATANCVRYCSGEVVFADIDPETYLLDIRKVRKLLEAAPKGTYKGIIPVDFAGRPIDMEAFRALAEEYGLWIIEDACHAPGAWFTDSKGVMQRCGNGHYADLAIFSFHPAKHIATGEGGMITTNSDVLYEKLLLLRTHGITRRPDFFLNDVNFASGTLGASADRNFPMWYMEMLTLGFNYRFTDFQAALGISQLSKAQEGLKRRRTIAETYHTAFSDKFFIKGHSARVDGHAYHLYVIEVENRLGLYNHLRNQHIYAQIHYIPIHLMPYYRQFGWKEGDMPHAEAYYKGCISLPMYPTLGTAQIAYVIDTINDFYGA